MNKPPFEMPEIVWLQLHREAGLDFDFYEETFNKHRLAHEVTWCEDRIHETDVPYMLLADVRELLGELLEKYWDPIRSELYCRYCGVTWTGDMARAIISGATKFPHTDTCPRKRAEELLKRLGENDG